MSRYYRRPGQRVDYSPYQTARYISRQARWQRGLRLQPDRVRSLGDGYEFWFFSSRGPANKQGHWVVTATENPDDGDPPIPPTGGGDLNSIEFGTSQSYTFRVYAVFERCGDSNQTVYSATLNKVGPFRLFIEPPGFGLSSCRAFNGDGSDDGNFTRTFPLRLTDGNAVTTLIFSNVRAVYGSDPSDAELPPPYYPEFGFDISDSGSGSGGSGSGSEPGNGGSGNEGKYSYTCTCPDFTKQQTSLFAPVYPSDFGSRSWTSSQAGALPGPPKICKHIAASSFRLRDDALFSDSSFTQDIPAQEFYFNRRDAYYDRLRRQRDRRGELVQVRVYSDRRFRVYRAGVREAQRQRSRLNRQLDSLSRIRLYETLERQGDDFTVVQRGYVDRSGQMTTEQYQQYSRYLLR